MKKRTVALLCALVMIVGVAIGGTMAWLTAQSSSVVNTFTTSDVNITLGETTGNGYQMVPGATLAKDPQVTVVEGSVDCYVFVKIDEVANDPYPEATSPKPVTYAVDSNWQAVDGEGNEGVYWRKVEKDGQGKAMSVLANDQVQISTELTKTYMNQKDRKPEITFTAYAIQEDFLKDKNGNAVTDIAKIWEMAQGNTSTNP